MRDWISSIEIYADTTWMWFGHGEALLRHDNDLVESMFCDNNRARFRPLFPSRGFPEDVNLDFLAAVERAVSMGAEVVDSSWSSFEELRAISWNEEALSIDPRVYKYSRKPDGSESLLGISLEYEGVDLTRLGDVDEAGIFVDGDTVYRRRRLLRRDLLEDSDFSTMMAVCEALAKRYGTSHVRWVVAFLS